MFCLLEKPDRITARIRQLLSAAVKISQPTKQLDLRREHDRANTRSCKNCGRPSEHHEVQGEL